MIIDVTQEDIDSAIGGSKFCPISLAFRRQTGFLEVSTGYTQIMWKSPENKEYFNYSVFMPDEACNFAFQYDNSGRQSVKPFKFEVPLE